MAKSSASGAAAVEEPKPRRARAARGMAAPARRRGSAPGRGAKSGREEATKARRRGQRPAAMGVGERRFLPWASIFGRPARGGEEWPPVRGRRERYGALVRRGSRLAPLSAERSSSNGHRPRPSVTG